MCVCVCVCVGVCIVSHILHITYFKFQLPFVMHNIVTCDFHILACRTVERKAVRETKKRRMSKENYKRDLQKRLTKETYKRDLQKRPHTSIPVIFIFLHAVRSKERLSAQRQLLGEMCSWLHLSNCINIKLTINIICVYRLICDLQYCYVCVRCHMVSIKLTSPNISTMY